MNIHVQYSVVDMVMISK